jgi:hypothetical protein
MYQNPAILNMSRWAMPLAVEAVGAKQSQATDRLLINWQAENHQHKRETKRAAERA